MCFTQDIAELQSKIQAQQIDLEQREQTLQEEVEKKEESVRVTEQKLELAQQVGMIRMCSLKFVDAL